MQRKEALELARKMSLEAPEEWGVYLVGESYAVAPVSTCPPGTASVARYNAGYSRAWAGREGKLPSPGTVMPRA